MSEVTMCDGPRCHEVKVETSRWIEMVEDSKLYDFHHPDCLNNWLNGCVMEDNPETEQQEVTVTLRGRIIGTDRERGYVFLQGCDAESGHHPWTYRLHWSTKPVPV